MAEWISVNDRLPDTVECTAGTALVPGNHRGGITRDDL